MKVNEQKILRSAEYKGELILIYHKSRPMKSGWYRYIKDSTFPEPNNKSYSVIKVTGDSLYVLEKSIHKDFNFDDSTISETRKKDGVYCVGRQSFINKTDSEEYIILAICDGIGSVKIAQNSYKPTVELMNSKHIVYKELGEKILEEMLDKKERKCTLEEEILSII